MIFSYALHHASTKHFPIFTTNLPAACCGIPTTKLNQIETVQRLDLQPSSLLSQYQYRGIEFEIDEAKDSHVPMYYTLVGDSIMHLEHPQTICCVTLFSLCPQSCYFSFVVVFYSGLDFDLALKDVIFVFIYLYMILYTQQLAIANYQSKQGSNMRSQ